MNSSMGMTDGTIQKAVYQYHNLLQKTTDRRTYVNLLHSSQVYFWDGNVAGMEEEGRDHFYFQDDLGSPMRLTDEAGRFVSEDFLKGHIAVPYTMNHYNYCWNRPMDLVDLNGMWSSLKDIGKGIKNAAVELWDSSNNILGLDLGRTLYNEAVRDEILSFVKMQIANGVSK